MDDILDWESEMADIWVKYASQFKVLDWYQSNRLPVTFKFRQ